jgi:hypothetical protein
MKSAAGLSLESLTQSQLYAYTARPLTKKQADAIAKEIIANVNAIIKKSNK